MRKLITFLALLAACQSAAGAQQPADQQICEMLQGTAAKSNKDAGTKVDSITTHMGMTVLCNMKVVDFRKTIDVPASRTGPSLRLTWR